MSSLVLDRSAPTRSTGTDDLLGRLGIARTNRDTQSLAPAGPAQPHDLGWRPQLEPEIVAVLDSQDI